MSHTYIFSFATFVRLIAIENVAAFFNPASYTQHPCVILNALEVLGFRVVSSTSSVVETRGTVLTW